MLKKKKKRTDRFTCIDSGLRVEDGTAANGNGFVQLTRLAFQTFPQWTRLRQLFHRQNQKLNNNPPLILSVRSDGRHRVLWQWKKNHQRRTFIATVPGGRGSVPLASSSVPGAGGSPSLSSSISISTSIISPSLSGRGGGGGGEPGGRGGGGGQSVGGGGLLGRGGWDGEQAACVLGGGGAVDVTEKCESAAPADFSATFSSNIPF